MANAILAAILSLIIPGLGQLYGGQGIQKAVIFFAIAVVLGILNVTVFPLIWIISVLFAIYAAYDAYINVSN